jgi:hypothetical protein
MRRILEHSPVKGDQLFRFEKRKPDGTTINLPNYYIRHDGNDVCTGTDRLRDAKTAVKKQACEDAQARRRRTAKPAQVTLGALLDLVIADYRADGQKSLKETKARIENGLRPYLGDMPAGKLGTDDIESWMAWRENHRMYKSVKHGYVKLRPATINRELSLLRRAYQLGYERKPQLV